MRPAKSSPASPSVRPRGTITVRLTGFRLEAVWINGVSGGWQMAGDSAVLALDASDGLELTWRHGQA